MMNDIGMVTAAMIQYEAGNLQKVNHFLKVYGFARAIGQLENLDEKSQLILEIAALTHDIGIKPSLEKYQSAAGPYQEKEGPPQAMQMLSKLAFNQALIDQVCWLIGHHHTYNHVEKIEHQILLEADFLVNAFEGNMTLAAIRNAKETFFKTKSGIDFLKTLYLGKADVSQPC